MGRGGIIMAFANKKQMLLAVIENWWGCIRDSELSEGLSGTDDVSYDDLKQFYNLDEDEENLDEVESQVSKDINELFVELREILKEDKS